VFTARYALSSYIKQIHFIFKGLSRPWLILSYRSWSPWSGHFTCNGEVQIMVWVRTRCGIAFFWHFVGILCPHCEGDWCCLSSSSSSRCHRNVEKSYRTKYRNKKDHHLNNSHPEDLKCLRVYDDDDDDDNDDDAVCLVRTLPPWLYQRQELINDVPNSTKLIFLY
jgi:hypothetical protein